MQEHVQPVHTERGTMRRRGNGFTSRVLFGALEAQQLVTEVTGSVSSELDVSATLVGHNGF